MSWSGLKKSLNSSVEHKRACVEPGHLSISIVRQCELLELSRSTYYYVAKPESTFNMLLMRLIDEQYTQTPFYGVPRMTAWLKRQGYRINQKRIRRLMRTMGLEAIYPKPRLSQREKQHMTYPYLLSRLSIDRPDYVWSADITYVRLAFGFVYLVAVMDWFSRYVLSWEVSISLETAFCLVALEKALMFSQPEIFNTDQGSQFTSDAFIKRLQCSGIRISMDGRGRVFDNIFVERLWRTVKYEEVYLHDYQTVRQAHDGLARYFRFYNTERPHSSLDYRTPQEVYFNQQPKPYQMPDILHLKQPLFLS